MTVLGIAAWMRYVTARRDDDGRPLAIDDPLASQIAEVTREAGDAATTVDQLMGIAEVFGDLGDDAELRGLLCAALAELTHAGGLAALRNATLA